LETNTSFMDMISCRNVSIYLEPNITHQMVNRFYDALVDGGWLVVGHSELSLVTYRRFQSRNFSDAVLYQRTGESTMLPDDRLSITQREPLPIFSLPVTEPTQAKPDESLGVSDIMQNTATEQNPLERAQELLDYGHSEEVRDLLLELFKSKPADAPACALLGRAYANLGRWSEAERWCRRAVFFDKLELDAYYTLALVLQHQRKLEQAIDAMKNVVYIDRNYVLGHFGLANLYHSQGQLSQANRSLNNAYRLLAAQVDEEMIPGSGGITVSRLRQAVVHAQQQWIAESQTREGEITNEQRR
jgi:chemotaxis protein methyltransferase CheR